jgi:hypothetical protein
MSTDLLARVEALRAQGAWRVDPMRVAQLQALARRLPQQGAAVQALLRRKIEGALDELAASMQQAAQQPAPRPIATRRISAPSALAALKEHLRGTPARQELASVTRFRRVWSNTRAQERVLQAWTQKPANAGPLNSHALVLESLELMPADYLRHFVSYAETLLWLQDVAAQAPAPAKPRRSAKARR